MRLATIAPKIWPFQSSRLGGSVEHDANEMMARWGAAAYETASLRSWQEDHGLIPSDRPGHWGRVAREIARLSGRQDREPRADFAA